MRTLLLVAASILAAIVLGLWLATRAPESEEVKVDALSALARSRDAAPPGPVIDELEAVLAPEAPPDPTPTGEASTAHEPAQEDVEPSQARRTSRTSRGAGVRGLVDRGSVPRDVIELTAFRHRSTFATGRLDEHDRFELSPLPYGTIDLRVDYVQVDGTRVPAATRTVELERGEIADIRWKLPYSIATRFEVLDANGDFIDAETTVHCAPDRRDQVGVRHPGNTGALVWMPEGEYACVAQSEGYRVAAASFAILEHRHPARVRIRLDAVESRRATMVAEEDDRAWAEARLRVTKVDWTHVPTNAGLEIEIDEDGRFDASLLPWGLLRVEGEAPHRDPFEGDIDAKHSGGRYVLDERSTLPYDVPWTR